MLAWWWINWERWLYGVEYHLAMTTWPWDWSESVRSHLFFIQWVWLWNYSAVGEEYISTYCTVNVWKWLNMMFWIIKKQHDGLLHQFPPKQILYFIFYFFGIVESRFEKRKESATKILLSFIKERNKHFDSSDRSNSPHFVFLSVYFFIPTLFLNFNAVGHCTLCRTSFSSRYFVFVIIV